MPGSQYDLGWTYANQKRYDEAKALLARSLVIREQTLGRDHLDVAASMNGLGWTHVKDENKGDLHQAELLLGQALAIRERILGAEDAW